jgi:hypothetical protein
MGRVVFIFEKRNNLGFKVVVEGRDQTLASSTVQNKKRFSIVISAQYAQGTASMEAILSCAAAKDRLGFALPCHAGSVSQGTLF